MSSGVDDEEAFEWEVRDSSTPFWQHAVAGSCAGVAEHVSMFPVDTVKTQMQASPTRLGVMEAVRGVLQSRGALGLMRGSTVIGAGCIPAHVGFFGTYELAVETASGRGGEPLNPASSAACGATATVVHDMVLTPHDVVKQRLQLGCFRGPLDCTTALWQQQGLRAFYRSLPVTLAMNIPYTGLLVAANDSLKRLWHLERGGSGEALSSAHMYFLCAGISGGFAAAMTLPLDVVKTRLQTQGLPSAFGAPETPDTSAGRLQALQHTGVLSTARSIMQTDGLRGFFRGLVPRVVLSAPSAAISWGVYETVRMSLHDLAAGQGLFGFVGMAVGGTRERGPALLRRTELAA
mmetsp:Transcript_62334/g.140468  ORF Transcript_62334/g.140468 Transcript_62334/m.140468 type:complete len:348 (+) Transcript_62334:101-1144(+)